MRKMFESIKAIKIKDYWVFLVYFLLIAVAGVVGDQVSKVVVQNTLPFEETVPLFPAWPDFKVIELFYTLNKGAAWGFGGGTDFTRILLTIVSWLVALGLPVYIVYMMAKHKKINVFLGIAMALVWGGDIGNLIDRTFFYDRGVVDFLSITSWWKGFGIFNIADSCLVIGLFIVLGYIIYESIKEAIENNKKRKNKINSTTENKDIKEEPKVEEITEDEKKQ